MSRRPVHDLTDGSKNVIERTAFDPDWTLPPGETLRECLDDRGMNQTEFAAECGYSLKHINQICQGHVRITAEAAVVFEHVLDIPAQFWMNLQSQHDIVIARKAFNRDNRRR